MLVCWPAPRLIVKTRWGIWYIVTKQAGVFIDRKNVQQVHDAV